ncbi:MAG: ECF-type sigma factor, partial [Planctomycetota bacterium]
MNVAKIPINDISVQDGQDFGNLADVLPIVYEELRRLARAKIAGEAPGNTLQTTALVH